MRLPGWWGGGCDASMVKYALRASEIREKFTAKSCRPRKTARRENFFVCKRTTSLLGCSETRRFARCALNNTARNAGENLHIRRPTKSFLHRPESMLQKTKHPVRYPLKLVSSPHAFSNRNFEKKTPFQTRLGVHLGAF